MTHTHWQLPPQPEKPIDLPRIHPLVAQLLYNRGITELSQAKAFLDADERLQEDPFLLPDMHQAVNRTYRALLSGEKFAVYGDFDADGITATALLVHGLTKLGGKAIPYIPHRSSEGYGLHISALKKLYDQDVSLVITVDTGITAFTEVSRAQKMGIDIIITDHHLTPASLPPALAVVDPKRNDSAYNSTELAGVGVAFKFLQALIQSSGHEELAEEVLDLVTLGTITDMAPLIGENRYWVKRGLQIINDTKRIGLQQMMYCAGLEPGTIDAQRISWVLGPRLNAAGRLDDATASYQLLLTQDAKEANALASELEAKNARRKQLTDDLLNRAREKILTTGADLPLLMTGEENYTQGVMGLVAGRLVEEFNRPVILYKFSAETCRGSGRSIPEFNLMAALEKCQDILSNFGGHTKAAGFNLPVHKLPELQQRLLNQAQEQLAGLDLRPHIDIDAEVPLSIFAQGTFDNIQQLAPFGCGNPIPTFISRNVEVIQQNHIGSQNEHLRLKLKDQGTTWDAVGFRLGKMSQEITTHIDIAYNLELDRWNGTERLRINLIDFAPSG